MRLGGCWSGFLVGSSLLLFCARRSKAQSGCGLSTGIGIGLGLGAGFGMKVNGATSPQGRTGMI